MEDKLDLLDDLVVVVKPAFPNAVNDVDYLAEKILSEDGPFKDAESVDDEQRRMLKSIICNSFLYGVFYSMKMSKDNSGDDGEKVEDLQH